MKMTNGAIQARKQAEQDIQKYCAEQHRKGIRAYPLKTLLEYEKDLKEFQTIVP